MGPVAGGFVCESKKNEFDASHTEPFMLTGVNSKRRAAYGAGLAFFFLAIGGASATTFTVDVAPGGQLVFSPASVSIQAGGYGQVDLESSGTASPLGPPVSIGLFDSGINNSGHTFSYTFSDPGTFAIIASLMALSE